MKIQVYKEDNTGEEEDQVYKRSTSTQTESTEPIPVVTDEHDRHARHKSYAPLEALVASGNDEASVLLHAREQAVVRVCALMHTRQPHHSRIARYPTNRENKLQYKKSITVFINKCV